MGLVALGLGWHIEYYLNEFNKILIMKFLLENNFYILAITFFKRHHVLKTILDHVHLH